MSMAYLRGYLKRSKNKKHNGYGKGKTATTKRQIPKKKVPISISSDEIIQTCRCLLSRLRSVKARYACQAPSICVKARDACQAPSICVKARDACQAPSICVKARDACQAPSICVRIKGV